MSAPPRVSRFAVPDLGVGVGWRVPHYAEVLGEHPPMPWFEVISENFMLDGGPPRRKLAQLAERYRVIPHGVSLGLGGPPDPEHEGRLLALVRQLDPPWFSDHICWTGVPGGRLHDLLPLPYTEATLRQCVERARTLQDRAERPLALENVSSYMRFTASAMPEWEFVARLVEEAGCALLLDVNNVYVSSINHGFDPREYLAGMPLDRVVQVHLAGHSVREGYRLDTHDAPVCDEVRQLYRELIAQLGPVSTLIEWDDNIPSFADLCAEAARVAQDRQEALGDARS